MARKRSPLVSQVLENLSRKAMQDYEAVIRQFVRRRHGIYVLYRRKRVQYIGLAQNLRKRIRHNCATGASATTARDLQFAFASCRGCSQATDGQWLVVLDLSAHSGGVG